MTKKVYLSGIQPSGKPHIGNYFGMMKQLLEQQHNYDVYVLIVDYHAMKSVRNAKEMKENITAVVLDYLALGLDPEKVVFFKQSDVSEHTELCWIFDTITTMPYLMRAHAFKDAEAKNKEIDVGTFNYPVLMAADILLYGPDIIPVGADQKQHVEIARDIAEKFNNTFGETFKLPEAMIMENVAVVPGTDGRKMSKSYGNTIPLFGTKDEIAKTVMSIVTDSKGESPEHVYNIHSLFRTREELSTLYTASKGNYKALKEALVEDIEAAVAPMRQRRESISDDNARVVLAEGRDKARERASKKMAEVRKKIGVAI